MINLKIGLDGVPSQDKIVLGNRWENNDESIVFEFPEEYADHFKYVAAYMKGYTDGFVILPINKDEDGNDIFYVSSAITRYAGKWFLYAICRDYEVDLEKEKIDISAKRNEHVFISDGIIGLVNKNFIEQEHVNNMPMDTNLKVFYEDLITLRCELKKLINETEKREADYNNLVNKPKINGVELSGDVSLYDFNYIPIHKLKPENINDLYTEIINISNEIKINQYFFGVNRIIKEEFNNIEILLEPLNIYAVQNNEDTVYINCPSFKLVMNVDGIIDYIPNDDKSVNVDEEDLDNMLKEVLD